MAWVKLEMMGAYWVGEPSADGGSATTQIEPEVRPRHPSVVLLPISTQAERHLFKIRGRWTTLEFRRLFAVDRAQVTIVELSFFCLHLTGMSLGNEAD